MEVIRNQFQAVTRVRVLILAIANTWRIYYRDLFPEKFGLEGEAELRGRLEPEAVGLKGQHEGGFSRAPRAE